MMLYKTIWQLLKTNKTNLMIGVIVTLVITFFYAQSIDVGDTQLQDAKILILSEHEAPIIDGMTDYLAETQTIVQMDSPTQKEIDDALYFQQVGIVLYLPDDFSDTILSGKMPTIDIQARPDAFSKTLVTQQVTTYLQTYLAYAQTLAPKEAMVQTRESLSIQGDLVLSEEYSQRMGRLFSGMTFNLLAYGLFMSIFSGFGVVNLAFNRKVISQRNQVAPLSKRKFNRQITLALVGYSILLTIGFCGLVLLLTRHLWSNAIGWHVLNVLVFILPVIAFSSCMTSLIKNSEAIGGISTIFIMGSCFIGGVFVPSNLLPAIVNHIAAFTPTYWFIQNNQLISQSLTINSAFLETFITQSGILLAFAAVFLVVQLVMSKDKSYLR